MVQDRWGKVQLGAGEQRRIVRELNRGVLAQQLAQTASEILATGRIKWRCSHHLHHGAVREPIDQRRALGLGKLWSRARRVPETAGPDCRRRPPPAAAGRSSPRARSRPAAALRPPRRAPARAAGAPRRAASRRRPGRAPRAPRPPLALACASSSAWWRSCSNASSLLLQLVCSASAAVLAALGLGKHAIGPLLASRR